MKECWTCFGKVYQKKPSLEGTKTKTRSRKIRIITVYRVYIPIRVEVAAAEGGARYFDNGISGQLELGVGAVLDGDLGEKQ